MNLARIILIVVAVAIAGLTAFLVRTYLASKESEIAQTADPDKNRIEAIDVLVADVPLRIGAVVGEDSFRWQQWPKDAVNENYIVKQDGFRIADLIGARARAAIAAGEPIVNAKLLKPDENPFLAGALTPGMRAVSIQVNPHGHVSGFILPGSQVDVIMTQEIETLDPNGVTSRRVVSETVLSDIRVLATDQDVDDSIEGAKLAATVTLEVDTKQAETIAVAQTLGRLSLSLRSLTRDPTREKISPFTSDAEISRFIGASTKVANRILVAARNLPTGTLIRDIDFEWRLAPEGQAIEGLIVQASVDVATLRGAFVRAEIKEGTPVARKGLILPQEQGFIVAALLPGMRAVSVRVDQVSGVSGYIAPGDLVDVIMTNELRDTSENPLLNPRRYSETIVRSVRVLGLEQTINDDTAKPNQGRTVTLEVSAKQAETVALGASVGTLSVALRAVPSFDAPDPDGESYTSDLFISNATVDFIVDGTIGAPQIVAAREARGLTDQVLGEAARRAGVQIRGLRPPKPAAPARPAPARPGPAPSGGPTPAPSPAPSPQPAPPAQQPQQQPQQQLPDDEGPKTVRIYRGLRGSSVQLQPQAQPDPAAPQPQASPSPSPTPSPAPRTR